MLDITKIFYNLCDSAYGRQRNPSAWELIDKKKNIVVLRDMSGPTDLNMGRTLVAKSVLFEFDQDEIDIANYIRLNYDYIAFYTTRESEKGNILRFAAMTQEEVDAHYGTK